MSRGGAGCGHGGAGGRAMRRRPWAQPVGADGTGAVAVQSAVVSALRRSSNRGPHLVRLAGRDGRCCPFGSSASASAPARVLAAGWVEASAGVWAEAWALASELAREWGSSSQLARQADSLVASSRSPLWLWPQVGQRKTASDGRLRSLTVCSAPSTRAQRLRRALPRSQTNPVSKQG
jgi:hypothetical protein